MFMREDDVRRSCGTNLLNAPAKIGLGRVLHPRETRVAGELRVTFDKRDLKDVHFLANLLQSTLMG